MKLNIKKSEFDLAKTFTCGQCFRWKEQENGSFAGIVRKRMIVLTRCGDEITLDGIDDGEFPEWEDYFDLKTDYSAYIRRFSEDKTLRAACESSAGIRILRQEPFETLLSFIISQNNNIPRITGIIERFCENFGEKTDGGYAFPTAEALRGITPEDLAPLRAGFRAKYLADAIEKVNSGEVDLSELCGLSTDDARERLKLIKGVGDKVADCVLLFAYRKTDAFPKDVWVKRVLAEFYPEGLPECVKGAEGIAQQFLFDYVRNRGGLTAETV